jgi:hypothetical protein
MFFKQSFALFLIRLPDRLLFPEIHVVAARFIFKTVNLRYMLPYLLSFK